MPAAATPTRRKAIRTSTRDMIIRRTITVITMMTITIMTSIAIMTIITANPMLMTASKPPPSEDRSGMEDSEAAALYRLMTWLSPSFPVGAFSYSSGIEWAVEAGDIVDAASLRDWLAAMLADGAGFCDGVLLCHAHRAASSHDEAGLRETAELGAAFVAPRERQVEPSTPGRSFIQIARTACDCEGLDALIACCDGAIVYPVAVGLVSAAHAIPLAATLHAFLHAATSNWISAGARLIPL